MEDVGVNYGQSHSMSWTAVLPRQFCLPFVFESPRCWCQSVTDISVSLCPLPAKSQKRLGFHAYSFPGSSPVALGLQSGNSPSLVSRHFFYSCHSSGATPCRGQCSRGQSGEGISKERLKRKRKHWSWLFLVIDYLPIAIEKVGDGKAFI